MMTVFGRFRIVAVAASLVGVAAWQAGSMAVGLVLSGGFVAIAFVLNLAGAALVREALRDRPGAADESMPDPEGWAAEVDVLLA